jgi:response regulator of citrate/malate metabolism
MNSLEVLIVEDNVKVSRTHQAFVERVEGFAVTGIANTIEEARLLVQTLEPDLVLLDIYLAEASGLTFLQEIRAERNRTDVILITAAREVEMLHRALQGGAFDYLIKPVFFDRFREALDNYRTYREQIDKVGALSQEQADRLFRRATPGTGTGEDLPKGIDTVTLEAIQGVFHSHRQDALSATEVGEQVGISRTTARKYLEYLISQGTLTISLDYGTKGRPERQYRLKVR